MFWWFGKEARGTELSLQGKNEWELISTIELYPTARLDFNFLVRTSWSQRCGAYTRPCLVDVGIHHENIPSWKGIRRGETYLLYK